MDKKESSKANEEFWKDWLVNSLAAMDDMVFVLDEESRFTHYHASKSAKLYVSPMKFIGKKHSEIMPPHMNVLFYKAFDKNKEGKVDEYEYSLKIDNELHWYSAKLSPIFLRNEFRGSVAVVRDITERKNTEEELKNSKRLIEKEVERKTKELKKANEKIKEYAEKLNLKIKRIDEKRVPLTDKEKLAFYGLVRYPGSTNKEIAEKLGMQTGTVNAIKNRLKKEGYFKTMYIPRLDMLGCSLLSVNYGVGDIDIENDKLVTAKMKEEIFRQFTSIPEKVYFVSSGKEAFSLDIAKDWSNYKEMQDSIEEGIQKKGIKLNSYETVLFPLNKSVFHDYFDFTGILKARFGLDIADSKEPEPEHKKHELSMTEKKLVYGLITNPELTVAELAEKINLSVPTICKSRKKLVEEGILKIVNFPDFAKVGMELMVLSCSKSTPSAEGTKKKGCKDNPNAFFSITTKTDCMSISAYEDYTQAKSRMNKYLCGPEKDTKHILIPLESMLFPKLEFAPLVKKIFELD
ncbi:winged helix-turn-helix transcriptional regulator [Candidatus Woesearchaeota archaeon]|nr:winged helix-turn-helix transcriptional regulator [Candidatus Woesearchaeota archaeon]